MLKLRDTIRAKELSTNNKTAADLLLDAIDPSDLRVAKRASRITSFLKKRAGFFGVEFSIIRRSGRWLLVSPMIAVAPELELKLENAKYPFVFFA